MRLKNFSFFLLFKIVCMLSFRFAGRSISYLSAVVLNLLFAFFGFCLYSIFLSFAVVSVCALFSAAVQLCAIASTGSVKGLTAECRGNAQGVGRGRGFAPGRSGPDVNLGIFALSANPLGVDRAGLARTDGRKRPISSPPLQLPSQSKKDKLPSDSSQCSDSTRDYMRRSLMKRIDDFFDPPPCDQPSGPLCSKPHNSLHDVFSDASPPPYIVLMESTRPGKNLGKYDRLALVECIDLFVSRGRTIFYNGPNQVKIQCESRDIVNRLDPDLRNVTMAVRRRTSDDGSISSKVEFTMAVTRVLRNIRLLGYSYPPTPAIPPTRRCFTCQRFWHISNQCRSSRSICEFCSEHHRTDSCPNKLRSAFCSNCCGDHVASSRECPTYRYEFEINKFCY